MALETAIYLVSEEIARRSGLTGSRYRTEDGRYLLNDRDLSRVRLTTEEYVSGLRGVEKISVQEAKTLMRQNNFAIGGESETINGQEG